MKLFHLSDLHLGKRVNGFSMIEDQKYILIKILNAIDEEKPDGVMIAGDVYDKSVPSAEAVELLDDFLVRLAARDLKVFVISGNHDSPERLAFGGRLMNSKGIYLSPVYGGVVEPVALEDEYGKVNVYMLPFIKPATVRGFFEDKEISSYTDAVRAALDSTEKDLSERNVLITHQFVTGASRSDSEDISVGGTDNIDASVFDGFDYVALGHIHGPQNIGSERIRYSGTPLKYSFSEAKHEKSITVVVLGKKGDVTVRTIPLEPKHDMVELRGKYEELMTRSFYENTSYREDYVHITLTDEDDIPDVMSKLRVIYTNLMAIDYDNTRTRHRAEVNADADVENKSPLTLFSEFFEMQNGTPMTEEQNEFMKDLIEEVWEDEK
ncbi:MAG: exonuclease SbcCD subunit D [Clostridia bacterium]|nr:exonuclease SbcCD subunit D [Clostridia bacterium]